MELRIKTTKKREILDITSSLDQLLAKTQKGKRGICNIVVQHTTCSLTTADLDPGGTEQDYLDFLEAITPKLAYRHPHNLAHVPDHILASIIGPTLNLPVFNGALRLGTWQRTVLVELDGPQERRLLVTFFASK